MHPDPASCERGHDGQRPMASLGLNDTPLIRLGDQLHNRLHRGQDPCPI